MAVTTYPGDNPTGSAIWGEITGDVVDQPDVLPSNFEEVDSGISTPQSEADLFAYTHHEDAIAATAEGLATDVGTASVAATADGDATGTGTVIATATAAGTATDAGTIGETISLGSKVYTVVAASPGFDEIAQGADATEYATNIANRVNADTADTLCTVVDDLSGGLAFTANTGGAAGNSITISTTDPNLTLDPAFTGGVDAGTISVGSKVYTVVASGATGDQINAGATATDYADNIAAKVTTDTASTLCTAINTGADLDFTANSVGTAGNSITLSTTDPNLTLGTFSGGTSVTITIGGKTYTVVASGATGDQINIGGTATDYADNIATKVTTDVATTLCTATNTGADLDFTAATAGEAGNLIAISTTDPDLTLDAEFTGGTDEINQAKTVASGDIARRGLIFENLLDINNNFVGNNFVGGYAATATAAGTTTLTLASGQTQRFTGSTTQTVVLPVVSTLELNWTFLVINDSTGVITVNSSGSNLVQTMAPGSVAEFMCIALTGTDATSWRVTYADPGDYTTTATAAGTTTLTIASTRQQYFTGSTTQTCVLPVVSTLRLGMGYRITNLSTGTVTINSSGGNLVYSLTAGQTVEVTCILITGTDAASWNVFNGNMSANGASLVSAANYAAMRGLLDLEVGVDVQEYIAPSSNIPDPAGGGTVDGEARAAIESILNLLEERGYMAG